ncbi:pyridoxamine 5'-phosphate oxidase family protein [Halobellus sp. Atlit-31R]|nr:pyridoxamine 5'-phosphate oxidase family protein [Halobellus sp. Atlit-31R]
MDHIEYAYTLGMDDETVEERLETTGTGVLALADGDDSYAIPLAHYYDGDGLYFRFGVTEGSRKRELLETTDTATYVLYGTEDTDAARAIETWSVVVTGRLTALPASEHDRFDTAEINRKFSPIRVFDEDIDEMEIVIAEFEIDSITGRTTSNA